MEQEMIKKKRGREGGDVEGSSNKSTKKQSDDLCYHHNTNNINSLENRNHEEEEDSNSNSYETSGENYLGPGVFDFPWLKEGSNGMISKAEEEWYLEDTFSSSLHDMTCYYTPPPPPAAEFTEHFLWESSDATCMESPIDMLPIDKFDEINVWSLEMEGFDCTWSSLLQQKGA